MSMCIFSISEITRFMSSSTFTLLYIVASTSFFDAGISGWILEGTFSHSWAENIFFDIFFVFWIDICMWVMGQEATACHITARLVHVWKSARFKTIDHRLEKTTVLPAMQFYGNNPFQTIARRTDKHQFCVEILVPQQPAF